MNESISDRLLTPRTDGDGVEGAANVPGAITEADLVRIRGCEEEIGYRFRDPSLLLQALTHSSIKTADNPSNERLEFLGDSVLGLVMTEFLYNYFQHHTEGDLTQIKSVVVSTSVLA